MIIAFTGHRPDKLGGYGPNPTKDKIKRRIRLALQTLKPEFVISGMALGVDQWACEVCLELGIPYIAAIPFEGQERTWPLSSRQHYATLLSKAQKVVVVGGVGTVYEMMQNRNEWMVDHCDLLLSVWNGSKGGGTANCVRYAQLVERDTVNLLEES